MNPERWLRLLAGSFVLVSVVLAWTVSPWFIALTAAVGLLLMQSAFTDWCPALAMLRCMNARYAPDSDASACVACETRQP